MATNFEVERTSDQNLYQRPLPARLTFAGLPSFLKWVSEQKCPVIITKRYNVWTLELYDDYRE